MSKGHGGFQFYKPRGDGGHFARPRWTRHTTREDSFLSRCGLVMFTRRMPVLNEAGRPQGEVRVCRLCERKEGA